MRILYNLAFIIFGAVYLPYLIITRRYRYGIVNRFGILSGRLKSLCSNQRVVWIHAVSLGEMKVASILAPLLRKTFPSYRFIFSSVTHTGNKVARTIATPDEGVFYLPFDLSFIVDRVVAAIKPEIFISLETELWPNLITSLYKFNARIILINGRVSDSSYFGYRKVRFIISRLLRRFSLLLMQSEQDAVRVLTLGGPKERVFVTGNLKFDLSLSGSISKRREIRERLSMSDDDILLIAGSTHRDEEEQIMDCFFQLKKEYKDLRLLIAPRHIERTQEIKQLLERRGYAVLRFSQLPAEGGMRDTDESIFLLDTIGELKTVYSAADIVFVGGSLVKKGGQNPIEAAGLAKPIIFGRFTFNFQDVVRSFLENRAAIQVENKDELRSAIQFLIDNPEERKKMATNAKDTVIRNSGSSQRTIDLIKSLL